MKKLGVSFWLSLAILYPAIFIVTMVINVFYTYTRELEIEDINIQQREKQISSMNLDVEVLAPLGFKKIEAFQVNLGSWILMYVFSHKDHPVYLTLLHTLQGKTFEISTPFKECSISTTTSKLNGTLPPVKNMFSQIIALSPLETVLNEHWKAMEYLREKGFETRNIPQESIRESLKKGMNMARANITRQSFWPLKVLWWRFTKPWLKQYSFRIDEQVRQGYITLPTPGQENFTNQEGL